MVFWRRHDSRGCEHRTNALKILKTAPSPVLQQLGFPRSCYKNRLRRNTNYHHQVALVTNVAVWGNHRVAVSKLGEGWSGIKRTLKE